jgi:hypothetical protein
MAAKIAPARRYPEVPFWQAPECPGAERPAGPQGRIRSSAGRIREAPGRTATPPPIARISRRIDNAEPSLLATRVAERMNSRSSRWRELVAEKRGRGQVVLFVPEVAVGHIYFAAGRSASRLPSQRLTPDHRKFQIEALRPRSQQRPSRTICDRATSIALLRCVIASSQASISAPSLWSSASSTLSQALGSRAAPEGKFRRFCFSKLTTAHHWRAFISESFCAGPSLTLSARNLLCYSAPIVGTEVGIASCAASAKACWKPGNGWPAKNWGRHLREVVSTARIAKNCCCCS